MHLTSLPSPFGIGDFGPAAYAWIDRLAEARQAWWQVLPLSPTGHSCSPFEPLSTFALNDYLLSPERLIADGLLAAGDACGVDFPDAAVDFDRVARFKNELLGRAWSNFCSDARPDLRSDFADFCRDQASWLDDYALFHSLKERHGGAPLHEWPKAELTRQPAALLIARQELADAIDVLRFGQFLADRQARELKAYAAAHGVRLIGDLPFFVALDSCDVWSHPELFLLDQDLRPQFLSGVPPDYFSVTGQLWGTPLYDWKAHQLSGYKWWGRRIQSLLSYVDLIRLDHFRAFAAAWHVPASETTAEAGQWLPGPGSDFFETMQRAFGGLPLIAEDLGLLTPDVYQLRDRFRLPGMRVLEFAFDGDQNNPFLPHNYVANTIVYTGTHDNDTLRGWYLSLSDEQRRRVWKYLKRPVGDSEEATAELLRLAWASPAALAMAPLQDLLHLDTTARMNVPGSTAGNWRWRCTDEMLRSPAFDQLRTLTEQTARAASSMCSTEAVA